jgi:predicted transcriptional regulator
MQPAKATVRELLERLPDDCSLDDILYHLYVVQKIELGLADAASGNVVPHAVAMQELRRKWLTEQEK